MPIERHVTRIVRESLFVLLLASVLSTAGGLGIEALGKRLVGILPLLVLMPGLNNMVGSFGTVVSSRFTEMLILGQVSEKRWLQVPELRRLIGTAFAVALAAAAYLAVVATGLAMLRGFAITPGLFARVLGLTVAVAAIVVVVLCAVAIAGGFWAYRRGHDPDNYLIPLTTALGDLASMGGLALAIKLLF